MIKHRKDGDAMAQAYDVIREKTDQQELIDEKGGFFDKMISKSPVAKMFGGASDRAAGRVTAAKDIKKMQQMFNRTLGRNGGPVDLKQFVNWVAQATKLGQRVWELPTVKGLADGAGVDNKIEPNEVKQILPSLVDELHDLKAGGSASADPAPAPDVWPGPGEGEPEGTPPPAGGPAPEAPPPAGGPAPEAPPPEGTPPPAGGPAPEDPPPEGTPPEGAPPPAGGPPPEGEPEAGPEGEPEVDPAGGPTEADVENLADAISGMTESGKNLKGTAGLMGLTKVFRDTTGKDLTKVINMDPKIKQIFDRFVAEAPTAGSNAREMELANYLLNHQGIQGGVVNASTEKHGDVVSEQKIYNTLGSPGFMSSNWGRF